MANSASARKSARQAAARRLLNAGLRSSYRTAVKSVRKAVAAGDAKAAGVAFSAATSVIDRIADKNIVHKNKAARHKSRLAAAVMQLAHAGGGGALPLCPRGATNVLYHDNTRRVWRAD